MRPPESIFCSALDRRDRRWRGPRRRPGDVGAAGARVALLGLLACAGALGLERLLA